MILTPHNWTKVAKKLEHLGLSRCIMTKWNGINSKYKQAFDYQKDIDIINLIKMLLLKTRTNFT